MIGTDTGAPGAARTLYGATSVLLRAFWVKSRRARPLRARTSQAQLTSSGTAAPTVRDSFSTQARVSSKLGPVSIGTHTWMPRWPVTLGAPTTPR